jgi:hypothetical protein
MTDTSNDSSILGPRGRILGLEWKDPKPKKAKKKKPLISKPKKIRTVRNKHDPKTKSQAYPMRIVHEYPQKTPRVYPIDTGYLVAFFDSLYGGPPIEYEVAYLDNEK